MSDQTSQVIVAEAINNDRTERHRIIDDGQGMRGLLCPPGHVNHRYFYEVTERRSGRARWPFEPDVLTTVGGATAGDVPTLVRAEAERLIETQRLVCSEAWLGEVYGYLRHCYFPSGVVNLGDGWHKTGEPEHHGGYLTARKYFPDHTPRIDLIESGGSYAAWECRNCGRKVQYEPRIDGFAVYGERTSACIRDEPHEPIRDTAGS